MDDFFKKSYIQIKDLYGYKLVGAVKQSEQNEYRMNHKQCKVYISFNEWGQAHKKFQKKK